MTTLSLSRGRSTSLCMLALLVVSEMQVVAAPAGGGVRQASITVVLRWDDLSSVSDARTERAILAICRGLSVPVTIGVIPFACSVDLHDPSPQELLPLSPAQTERVRRAARTGLVEVALHGYSHQTTDSGAHDHGRYTEFRGVDYDTQVRKIAEGRAFLQERLGVKVTTFIPPWNSYDDNTVRALESLGLHTLSALPTRSSVTKTSLRLLPQTCGLRDLKAAIIQARRWSTEEAIVVGVFHNFAFVESDVRRGFITLQGFQMLLNWVKAQPDVRVVTLGEASSSVCWDLGSVRVNKQVSTAYMLRRLTPPLVSPLSVSRLMHYPSARDLHAIRTRGVVVVALLCASGLVSAGSLACLVGRLAAHRGGAALRVLRSGSKLCFVLCLAYALWDLTPTWRALMALSCVFGVTTGLHLCPCKRGSRGRLDGSSG